MNTRKIIYARWLSVAIPLLCFLLWTTTSSTAYPCLRRRNYLHLFEPNPAHKPLDPAIFLKPQKIKLKGPLRCNGTITPVSIDGETTYVCEGQALCKGTTSCIGALTCTDSWFNDKGRLACKGGLLCDGRLACNETLPATCLPGLRMMPDWALGIFLGLLILISGFITGCTAALNSLAGEELGIYTRKETAANKKLSEKISQLKTFNNLWVISCLLMCSVTINLSLPLISACLLDNHLWGLLLSAGLLIVIGEILPQIIFSRYPVALLRKLMWFIYIILALYAIPAGILVLIFDHAVDCRHGSEEGSIIYITKISALVNLRSRWKGKGGNPSVDSVRVMQGALDLENKVAGDIMKPISDVKMLDVKDRMNIDRWKKVISWGYSRIPVYSSLEENRGADSPYQDCPIKIWGCLHCFDMMSPDPKEVTTLRSFPIHELPIVDEDYPLWDLLHLFQKGFSHIAIVEKVPRVEPETPANSLVENPPPPKCVWRCAGDAICKKLKFIEKEGDHPQPVARAPRYWTGSSIYKVSREQPSGIVTMEDVLKALLRSPIFDEKDTSHSRRRMACENGSPRGVFESELQEPFSRESLNTEELEPENQIPTGLTIQLATRNENKSSESIARRTPNSGNKHLSFSKPLVPLSNRERRGNALTDPLGGTSRRNSPKIISSKAKGKGKAVEVRKAISENDYSKGSLDDFELETFTGDSIPSSIFSHSTGTTSNWVDLLGLRGEYTNSSDFGLSTLEEESSASVHSTSM
ncbi:hypothetical protein L873DRAFT_1843730 [Choiromyces venosus 120613-1]|uniref:CNNM transmembrane domain-containing protein n=1 Tax=Choiromyces venosus 120613-1 TaxID=1336337 RepID=A0A3N4JPL1_9PEZI|nr:hypothetical protein L873DRAFT_1843730 [Choiromyces venosus 120613-1]